MQIKKICLKQYNELLKHFHPTPHILSNEDTIRQLAEQRKSLGRFGDGEMILILQQGDLSFQKKDPILSARLSEVLSSAEDGFLVGLPQVFSHKDLMERTPSSAEFWEKNLLLTRHAWYKRIDFSRTYANSTFTRNYLTLKDKSQSYYYFQNVKSIWKNRRILLIEGDKSRVGIGNDLFENAVEVKRIICPSEQAFGVYDQILKAAITLEKDYLVLIALGPTATVLAYDLYRRGYQAIDIGHIDIEFEWFLHGSTAREMVSGKWVAEAGGMSTDTLQNNVLYHEQIITKIEAKQLEKNK